MDRTQVIKAMRDIGLALSITHNTVTTDSPGVEPKKDYSWKIDHSKELAQLASLEELFDPNTDNCPLCGRCNTSHKNISIEIIETHNVNNVEWGVSFNGFNPEAKNYFLADNKEDAFRLREIILAKFSPIPADCPASIPSNKV